jgi:hypothetical protein
MFRELRSRKNQYNWEHLKMAFCIQLHGIGSKVYAFYCVYYGCVVQKCKMVVVIVYVMNDSQELEIIHRNSMSG